MHFSFDVILLNNSFYIDTSDKEYLNQNATLNILKKVKHIIENNLVYNPTRKDLYSELSPDQLVIVLKEQSDQVYSQCIKVYSQCITKNSKVYLPYLRRDNEVNAVYSRIKNHPNNQPVFNLPTEMILEVCKYLKNSEIKVFSGLNFNGNIIAKKSVKNKIKIIQ